jgi:protein SCO1/2
MTVGPPVPRFDLVDHDDRPVSLDTYRGRHVLVFFGFTHCRMVCPRALARLTAALDELGEQAAEWTALYVTVDPERDDPSTLRSFLSHSAPRFTGLTGTPDRIEAAKQAFGVFTRRTPDPADPDGYAMPHTALTYVLGPDGSYITHLGDGLTSQQVAERLSGVLTTAPSTS